MFLRIDKLQIDLPAATKFDPNAAAVQELLGGLPARSAARSQADGSA
jgi:Mn-containing catalase